MATAPAVDPLCPPPPIMPPPSMLDGGMGSIRFVAQSKGQAGGRFNVAERFYNDADNVLVSFTLNLDDQGEPWEIDVCRVDSSPLKKPPSSAIDLRATP
jgi:hypothetical protein